MSLRLTETLRAADDFITGPLTQPISSAEGPTLNSGGEACRMLGCAVSVVPSIQRHAGHGS